MRLKSTWNTPTGTRGAGADSIVSTYAIDGASAGHAPEDKMNYIVLGCDIDVDSDNDDAIDSTNQNGTGEDFFEALPSTAPGYTVYPEFAYGMIVAVNNGDADDDGNPDNGWNGTDWSGPNANTIENEEALRPGVLRGLGVSDSDVKASLDLHSPVVRIKKVSGEGAVRLFAADEPKTLIGAFVKDGDAVDEFGGTKIWDRIHDSDTNFLVEGLRSGEVMLACQLLLNGVVIHQDVVRITGVQIMLIADTDRDGKVDLVKDLKGKADWTKDRGAIFSVNCDRDDRANRRVSGGVPIPDAIHFDDTGTPVNEDFLIENEDDELDIAPMLIPKIGPIPAGFKVFLKTNDLEDVQRTHVYKKIKADPTNVAFWGGATATATSGADASGGPTTAAEARPEIDITRWVDPASGDDYQGDSGTGDCTFGLEGLMFRYVGAAAAAALKFDGEVDFTLELRKGAKVVASSAVRLKVAPWMMLSRDQASEEVWAFDAKAHNAQFLADLRVDAGGQVRTEGDFTKAGTPPQWFQDHVEIGYTQRPGGPKTHVVFRLPYGQNPTWPLFNLLKKDVGAFQLGKYLSGEDVDRMTGDFGGNLEILPPKAPHRLGRVAMGDLASNRLQAFLLSQEVQSPFFDVPVEWLKVGHIDEVTSFLAGGTVVLADPTLAWTLLSDPARIPEADHHQAVFFATGVKPEGGAVGGGSPTRLYDGPATGTISVAMVATSAVGSITTVAKANLIDSETFTIGDGRSTQTFEFDVAGDGVTVGNVAVDVSAVSVQTADHVRDLLVTVINAVPGIAISAAADGPAKVRLTNVLPGTAGNIAISETVGDAGFLTAGFAGGADNGILDGETVAISDGVTTKTFEFDTFGGIAAGHVRVDISAATNVQAVRDALGTAINGVGGGYTVTAVAGGTVAAVHLWNSAKGVVGNQPITETVAHPGFTVVGMAGGKAGGRDFTAQKWNFVRTFTYAADGKPEKGQVAHIKAGGRHDGWIEIDKVWNTTSKLVPGGGATASIADYAEWDNLQAPAKPEWWTIPRNGPKPDKYVLAEGMKAWHNGTPALVTVEEVLADDDFKEVNTTRAQERIDVAKAKLNAASAGLVYKHVPSLFFGNNTDGFTSARTAVAFNPGPANLQTINGKLYVPRQFCPVHQTTGVDIFAEAISDALGAANVRWVDDWELYHALDGEVHCGTAVKHEVLNIDWWTNQP